MSKLAKFTVIVLAAWAVLASVLAGYDAIAARRWQRTVRTLERELRATRATADAVVTGTEAARLRQRIARLADRLDTQTLTAERASTERDDLKALLDRALAATQALGRCAADADAPLTRAATSSTVSTSTTSSTTSTTAPSPTSTSTAGSGHDAGDSIVVPGDPAAAGARATCREAATQGLAVASELDAALKPATATGPSGTTGGSDAPAGPAGRTGTATTTTKP